MCITLLYIIINELKFYLKDDLANPSLQNKKCKK